MIRYLLAGAAVAAIASPAAARDHSAYFGLEAGPMFVRDMTVRNTVADRDLIDVNYKTGVDGDLIMGYDFGIFRAEFEASHKWAKQDNFHLPSGTSIDASGHSSGYTTMANVMVDLGKNDTVNFYAGAGAGLAWMHEHAVIDRITIFDIKSNGHFAWQGIAGVRWRGCFHHS